MVPTIQTEVQERLQKSGQKILPAEPRTGYSPRIDGRRIIKYLLMGSAFALALVGMYYYALVQSYQSTDDAFIEGKITGVAPKISGGTEGGPVSDA